MVATLGVAYGVVHYVVQGKGGDYHLYPLVAFAAVALFAELEAALAWRPLAVGVPLVACCLTAAALLGARGIDAVPTYFASAKVTHVRYVVGDLARITRPDDLVQVLDTTEGGVHALLLLGLRQPTRWSLRFVQDDAYIVFRYAEHLARGEGLVWNVGERVEGYSSFLYTVLLGGTRRLGPDPVTTSHALGLAAFLGSLLTTFQAARLTFGSATHGLLTMALLGANYTFSTFATGGLETSLHAVLVCAGLALLAAAQTRGWSAPWPWLTSILIGLLMLTRPDSVIPCVVFLGVALWRLRPAESWRPYGQLIAPAAAMLALWLTWKLLYYGELLPNTYHVKVASSTSLQYGVRYLYLFFASYWLIPVAVLTVVLLPRLLREGRDALVASVLLTALWIPYVARVGGDFMEFRFMVPLLPALMLLIVATLRAVSTAPVVRAGLVAIVLAGSASHAVGYGLEPGGARPESRDDLRAHLTSPDQSWVGIGRALRQAAGDDRTLTIAVAPAGAIPYHSKLPSIDMLGLSDRWVARHGDILGSWPGHQRVAPYSYLERRGVHLIIGQPVLRSVSQPRPDLYPYQYFRALALPTSRRETVPPTARVVEMPVTDRRYLPMLYVRPYPVVERQVSRGAWRQVRCQGDREGAAASAEN